MTPKININDFGSKLFSVFISLSDLGPHFKFIKRYIRVNLRS